MPSPTRPKATPWAIVLMLAMAFGTGGEVAHAQACTVDVRTLATGDVRTQDGAIEVTVDAVGWFGTASFGARQATWNPPGPDGPTRIAAQSVVVIDGQPLRECIDATADVLVTDPDQVISTGRIGLTDFRLTQTVHRSDGANPARFVQRYELTPRQATASSLEVMRLAGLLTPPDGGRAVAGRGGGFLGGAGGAGAVDPQQEGPLVGITGDLDGDPTPTRWAITEGRPTDGADIAITLDEANIVQGDADGDRLTDDLITPDDGRDTVLRQTWTTPLNANDTVVFTSTLVVDTDRATVAAARPATHRVSGRSRTGTAAELARLAFPPFGSSAVLIARSDSYADALSGSVLARQMNAPLLLTSPAMLNANARQVIGRLRATTAVILGGTGAISPAVEEDLAAAGIRQIDRIAGGDRFATAVAVADRLVAGGASPASIYLTEGANTDPGRGWPDALAVSALAAAQGRPILTVLNGTLPPSVRDALTRLGVTQATVVGGAAAVSSAVEEQVAALGIATGRIAGPDRYGTAAAVTAAALATGDVFQTTLLASGANWPDALAAGATAAALDATLVLVPPTSLDVAPASQDTLVAVGSQVQTLIAVGGPAALSDAVLTQARDLVTTVWRADDRPGTWSSLPVGPITGRSHAVSVWTGQEFLVWGGLGPEVSDGAAYTPGTQTWRPIADAPFGGRHSHQAVWSGDRMIVWGTSDGSRTPDGRPDEPGRGSYDPATDTWTVLPNPPLPTLRESVATWTGSELLVVGSTDAPTAEAGELVGAKYNPTTGAWRTIAPPPLTSRVGWIGVFTDTEFVLAGGAADYTECAETCSSPTVFTNGAAYDPALDVWRPIADAPSVPGRRAVWTGGEVVALEGPDGAELAYDPDTDNWRSVAPPPAGAVASDVVAWTGQQVLTWQHPSQQPPRDSGGTYDPATDSWTVLPPSGTLGRSSPTAAWAGDRLLIWGGSAFEPGLRGAYAGGLVYTPG